MLIITAQKIPFFEEAFLHYSSKVLKKPPMKPAPLHSPHKTSFLPLPTIKFEEDIINFMSLCIVVVKEGRK